MNYFVKFVISYSGKTVSLFPGHGVCCRIKGLQWLARHVKTFNKNLVRLT